MKIYAARHGQTQWNVDNIVCGRSDIPLTEEGEKQALALAEKAAGYGLDIIIASPMIRAQQTARAVADRCGIEVLTDERLIEQCFGMFEGASRADEVYQRHKRKYFHKHGGGESMMQLAQRVYNALDDIIATHKGKNVLLVCHAGVCRVIRSYFVDMENEEMITYSPDNRSIVGYDVEE